MAAWCKGWSRSKDKDWGKVAAEAVVCRRKEKARSFDEGLISADRRRGCSLLEGGGGGQGVLLRADAGRGATCHPLPRPLVSGSGRPLDERAGSGGSSSSSVTSVSSSGDSDSDGTFFRSPEPSNTPKRRSFTVDSRRQHDPTEDRKSFPCSPAPETENASPCVLPRRNAQRHGSGSPSNETANSHQRPPKVAMYNSASRSPLPKSKTHVLPRLPSKVISFEILSDIKSSPRPLPLPPSSPTSPLVRSLQSKWKKGKLIGRGTFGRVYEGFNSESGQMCAIKNVDVIADDPNSKECLKQLSQEINLLSQLSHANIVQYYGSELGEDSLSVYLEHVSGGSIHKLLQEYGPFGESVIRNYAKQILSGIAYLHGKETVHRDIKGANILVGSNGEIKLADFGMAKHIPSSTSLHSFKGSPYWMAPEVIANTGGYRLSVDIWSLGCTIIEMATAKPPWSQHSGVQAIFKIGNCKEIPEIPDNISNDGKNFVRLCLQRDPSSRLTAMQLLSHPFVQDQADDNTTRDVCPSFSDWCHFQSQTCASLSNKRSSSPSHERDYSQRPSIQFSPAHKNTR